MIALLNANALHIPLADKSVQCVVTSPPYWGLRDYGISDQIGLESTPAEYVAHIVAVMRECWRVLRDDGVMWLNLGDSYAQNGGDYQSIQNNQSGVGAKNVYTSGNGRKGIRKAPAGLKPKDLCGIPWRCAFALQEDGWYLRSDIIWSKPNPMPESVTDRPTKAHEYVFLLTKRARYYYDAEAIKENLDYPIHSPNQTKIDESRNDHDRNERLWSTNGGRNKRSVWEIATSPYSGAHYATFPPDLVRPMVLAGTSPRACEICGAPWERIVDRIAVDDPAGYNGSKFNKGKTNDAHPNTGNGNRYESKSTGWRPTCHHDNSGSARCVILDPFCGSGTVGQVCHESGRDFVGIDLSLKYLTDNAMPRALNTNTQNVMANLPLFAEWAEMDQSETSKSA